MKKNVFGKKLKRDKNERKALFKSLMSSLVLYEKLQTSEAKAKAIRPEIEKLVTKAKNGSSSAKKILEKNLTKPAFDKILNDIAPRFLDRQGGYTRILKMGKRLGDNSQIVLMEWVEMRVQNSNLKGQNITDAKKDKKTVKVEKPKSRNSQKIKQSGTAKKRETKRTTGKSK